MTLAMLDCEDDETESEKDAMQLLRLAEHELSDENYMTLLKVLVANEHDGRKGNYDTWKRDPD